MEVETELELEMEVGTRKQNRSREEREKGENKGKIGNKGLFPDRVIVGRDGVMLRRYGIRVAARICFFDRLTGMAGRSIHFLTHIGHMFGLISYPYLKSLSSC